MDKCLVAVEQPMPPGEQIAFQPTLALMLAQHLHHPATRGEERIVCSGSGIPLAIGCFKNSLQPVGASFVWAKDAKIVLILVEFDNIAQKLACYVRIGSLHTTR